MLTRKEQVFLKVAAELSTLSTCPRKAVGALIVRDGRCVSWGYNGAPPGLPHCEENGHGYIIGLSDYSGFDGGVKLPQRFSSRLRTVSEKVDQALRLYGCRNATHAEANALAFAARQGISTDGGTLFVTVSPCDVCTRLLIAAGIRQVFYLELYRDPTAIELLRQGGVSVIGPEHSAVKDPH